MKLRVRGNSIRLRLTRGEVAALADTGRVEDGASFPGGGRLGYVLASAADATALSASIEGATVIVTVPAAQARAWAEGDDVGLEAEQALDGGATLRVLVEKDFACLKPREGEDDADAFPHPNTC